METLGSSLARLPVRFWPPHPCIVLLVLVILLALPAAAAEEVYQVEGDAADPVPVYQQTAVELLADAGIMPLAAADWSTTDSANLQRIADRLLASGGSSAASLLSTISSKIGTNPNTIFYFLNSMDNRMSNMYNAMVGTGHVGGVSMGEGLFGHLRNMTTNYLSPISSNMSATYSQVKAIADKMDSSGQSLRDLLVAPAGWEFVDHGGFRRVLDRPISLIELLDNWSLGMWERDTTPADWFWLSFTGEVGQIGRRVSTLELLDNGFLGLVSRMQSYFQRPVNRPGLLSDGSITGSYGYVWNLADLTADGFVGLAKRLSGDDRTTIFSFLQEDIQSVQQVTADNLLDALGIMGTQLQQPLQRLAYVFANPQDLEIRQDVSDNVDSAQDNFFKPDGAGAVSPGNIQDAAGISGGAAGALQSPGSVGDVTGQINNPDNFSFFSSVTLGNLDTVPVPASDDDDGFIDFYDPDNAALWEALGK